jgi:hypothetical protein
MTITRIAAAAALLASVAPAAAQQAPAPQGQAGRWQVDGSTDRCVLTRRLEGPAGAATFVLRTIPGSGRYDLILGGRELPTQLRRAGEIRLALAPAGVRYQGDARAVDLPGELGPGVAIGPLPAAFRSELAASSRLELGRVSAGEAASWTLPSAARAAEAMAFCESEKQIEWGADPGAVEAGSTPPKPVGEPGEWLTLRDLGIAAATVEGSAAFAAVFRLAVAADGRATSCTLVESAGNFELRGDPCRALRRRARFEPARNAAGQPAASIAIHVVSMRMDIEFRLVGV